LKLEKIKHGFKTLAECGGIRVVDDTSSLYCTKNNLAQYSYFSVAVGLVDAGETPETAALRELYEETGYTATVRHVTPGIYIWNIGCMKCLGIY
jgi:ADP-ribose pyrophosphatase YjhB (NUDIX family)